MGVGSWSPNRQASAVSLSFLLSAGCLVSEYAPKLFALIIGKPAQGRLRYTETGYEAHHQIGVNGFKSGNSFKGSHHDAGRLSSDRGTGIGLAIFRAACFLVYRHRHGALNDRGVSRCVYHWPFDPGFGMDQRCRRLRSCLCFWRAMVCISAGLAPRPLGL